MNWHREGCLIYYVITQSDPQLNVLAEIPGHDDKVYNNLFRMTVGEK